MIQLRRLDMAGGTYSNAAKIESFERKFNSTHMETGKSGET